MLKLPALLKKIIFPLSIFIALISPTLTYAEVAVKMADNATATGNRPKTALVLSGGGARGAAHVGVLKVLEELNIPIDFVVGTSMGSIVGGLYAAGYSPAELENLFKTIDWDLALRDTPPREMLSYRRKQADKNLLAAEVGFHDGAFTIPEGLIAGQGLGFILKNAVQRAGAVISFDDLPIPFRAVATDLGNGKLVALASGDLATAMRASMSVPSVFVPVTIDGRKLIDGGLVSNLPVQIARDMGAERIIAVDISSGFIDEDKLGSVLGVSLQMINVLMQQNINNSIAALQPGDLYLRPDLGDFSSTNFKEAYTIIENGYKEASAKRISLGNFAVPYQQYRVWQQVQRQEEPKQLPVINFVEVKGNQRVNKQQILARIQQPLGDKLDFRKLENDLNRVYAIGDFESVDYNIVRRTDEGAGLKVEVQEKPWGPHYLRTAIQLSDDFEGGSNYNLHLNHRWTQLNRLGGEWENALQIGKDRSFITKFHQPLTYDGKFFISSRLEISGDNRDIYSDNERVGEYLVNQRSVKLDVGWIPHSDSEVRLGLEYGKVDGELRVGDSVSLLGNFQNDIGAVNISAGLDRQDSPYFPTEGVRAEANLKIALDELGSAYDYNLISFNASKFWSRDNGSVIGVHAAFASGFNDRLPTHEQFSLGGLGRLSGLNKGQLRGSHLGLASAVYYQQIEGLPGNFGFSLEAGNVWQNNDDISFDDLTYSTSLFWGYDSPLGAFYLGYGITDYGKKAVHLTLGQPF